MISKEEAARIAETVIADGDHKGGRELVLIESLTEERDFGWVFFYNSRRFSETADPRDAVLGNSPFLVDRRDGSVHHFPDSYRDPGSHIADYQRAVEEGNPPPW